MDIKQEIGDSLSRLDRYQTIPNTINLLNIVIDKVNPHIVKHHKRVAQLAGKMAQNLKYPNLMVDRIKLAASIHDIGKIDVPIEFLIMPPDRLGDDIFEIIKQHPQTGYEIIKEINFSWSIAQMVLQHHERLDGSGYPQGLEDSELLAGSKVIAVADVVEAISSHRTYRPAVGVEAALTEIEDNKGKLYDERAVDVCLDLFNKENFEFR